MMDSLISWFMKLFESFTDWLLALLPDWLGSGYADLASAFGPTASYFAWLSGLDVVAPTILGAYVLKFVIRRLPVIG